jgi:hypothetical protein
MNKITDYIYMNKYEPKVYATGLRNTINMSVVIYIKKMDIHWEESRSGTSNRGQVGEWPVSALKEIF